MSNLTYQTLDDFDVEAAMADYHMEVLRRFLVRMESESEDNEFSEFSHD